MKHHLHLLVLVAAVAASVGTSTGEIAEAPPSCVGSANFSPSTGALATSDVWVADLDLSITAPTDGEITGTVTWSTSATGSDDFQYAMSVFDADGDKRAEWEVSEGHVPGPFEIDAFTDCEPDASCEELFVLEIRVIAGSVDVDVDIAACAGGHYVSGTIDYGRVDDDTGAEAGDDTGDDTAVADTGRP